MKRHCKYDSSKQAYSERFLEQADIAERSLVKWLYCRKDVVCQFELFCVCCWMCATSLSEQLEVREVYG